MEGSYRYHQITKVSKLRNTYHIARNTKIQRISLTMSHSKFLALNADTPVSKEQEGCNIKHLGSIRIKCRHHQSSLHS